MPDGKVSGLLVRAMTFICMPVAAFASLLPMAPIPTIPNVVADISVDESANGRAFPHP